MDRQPKYSYNFIGNAAIPYVLCLIMLIKTTTVEQEIIYLGISHVLFTVTDIRACYLFQEFLIVIPTSVGYL